MDSCYLEQNAIAATASLPSNISSPEMFDSDGEDETIIKNIAPVNMITSITISPYKPSQAELVAKSDNHLLLRINKFLSGVPPPPKHTICQSDCNDLLMHIQQNRHYFWIPYPVSDKSNFDHETTYKFTNEIKSESIDKIHLHQRTKCTSRNLTHAFEACNPQTDVSVKNLYSERSNNTCDNLRIELTSNSETSGMLNTNKAELDVSSITNNVQAQSDASDRKVKQTFSSVSQDKSLLYNTISEKEALSLTWPEAYSHKFHGIHYNRNSAVEDFENLTIKLCERYVGAETQSTCNVWFSKQAPGSARKRKLLSKHSNGQSPGKRLNYLTKRRKTFSSANLQGLGLSDKKQLILNVKKPISRKGKSPRGKSPRGKSPRGKSPRSSAKKRVVRRLTLEDPSPRKLKLETSKRALFQSPSSDRAGPSSVVRNINTTPRKIKRALFPTPKKKEDDPVKNSVKVAVEDTRKRKNEDDLEGPKNKWAKSLSFDCPHELQNNSINSWDRERHSSSGNMCVKSDTSLSQGRSELSDTHRKKLLWAVAEALRSKGIGMGHPRFKQYASNLARTVKKFMPDLENRNIPRKPGSTSDRMLKLAKYHVILITDSRSTN